MRLHAHFFQFVSPSLKNLHCLLKRIYFFSLDKNLTRIQIAHLMQTALTRWMNEWINERTNVNTRNWRQPTHSPAEIQRRNKVRERKKTDTRKKRKLQTIQCRYRFYFSLSPSVSISVKPVCNYLLANCMMYKQLAKFCCCFVLS